jgi:hypothetical protein
MPFESVYMEYKNGNELSVSGFKEFPFVVPRYLKASHEIYGRSPAMTALPDVKMLNEMVKTTIKAAQKQVDPPLLVPDDGFLLPVRTVPGGLNFYRSGTRDRIEPLNIGANNPLGLNMEEQRRDAIRAVFYVNQLMMQQGPQMTATEVIQRNEEKMRLLGPVLGRLQSELLKPLIDRVFNILLRNNQLPPAPEFLSGQDIEIEYVSPLAKAQKSTELQSIMRAIEILGSMANVAPVFDYVNFDNLVKHLADIVGVPQKILKSQSQVNAERQQAQQQQQEQMQMQQLQQVAKAGGDIAPLAKALPEEAKAVANADRRIMGQAKDKERNFEKYVEGLKKNYQFIFNTDEGKQVMSDLEKRCHHHTTTNVKGDSHESAYMEGQRSILLFIKAMLQNDNEKGK